MNVLWQSEQAIVVDKPAGIATQAPPGIDCLEKRLRGMLGGQSYLAMVHRLDRPVSGLVLAAKTKRAARLLSEQFATGKVVKTYHAFVSGEVMLTRWLDEGAEATTTSVVTWRDWIAKVPGQAHARIVPSGDAQGKQAVTRVRDARYRPDTNRTRLTLQPETGRMHQLRVQAAHRGVPILGDEAYGSTAEYDAVTGAAIALRAVSLEFFDPKTGKRVRVEGGS